MITVDRRVLELGLSKVTGAVGTKVTMPVLSHVMIDFDGDRLIISATDLEISVQTRVAVRGEGPLKMTLPGDKLAKIARVANGDTISIDDAGNGRAVVRCGKSKFELPTIPIEDFPEIDIALGEDAARIDAAAFKRALEKTEHAIAGKDDTFVAGGALLHGVGEKYRVVTTDGHRLAWSEIDGELLGGLEISDKGVIIPSNGIRQMIGLLDGEKAVRMELSDRTAKLATEDTHLACSLLDADFPEYDEIIPQCEHSAKIGRADILGAIKRLMISVDSTYKHVRIALDGSAMTMTTGNDGTGTAEELVEISADDGTEAKFSAAYNISYLKDACSAVGHEAVKYQWLDELLGGVITDPGDDGFLALIMPMVI